MNRNFQNLLEKYFNGGWLTISDGLISSIFHKFILRKNASKLQSVVRNRKALDQSVPEQKISILVYTGKDPRIQDMITFMKPIADDLIAAIVHGSFATEEVIRYSDFDGLLIIRDVVFEDKERLTKLAEHIHQSRRIMHEIDPLQHHGWFVMTEADLKDFPLDYLPLEVLSYSRSLLSESDLDLNICLRTKADYFSPVKKICRRIRKISQTRNRPQTIYQLKSILSEFMMLPTLYIQARDQRGIFKKFSFTAAAADFNQGTWSIMEEVSRIRAEWPEFENKTELKKFRKIGYIWMKYRKKKGPRIPRELTEKLNDDFYKRMANLANQVEVNLFR